MKRNVKKVVSYSKNFKDYVIYAVVRDGFSIASVCTQWTFLKVWTGFS
ncbi:MAG: hypothetical protein LHW64_01320 [Candidatus Cloacimonetes bacterium]|jgi:hypothetical protein|nr:hypothetical protein [Candidatus Cloacimonadota bacterium]MCK9185547.1 hypothetical protein [Candidatus Cloacimonadota bacterium]MCK9584902.1 hypothetical protein [Candidatus Cloacimonadota bacterium]MDY0228746.1 hypothetical protein [Candidatus Cloacimonadaceae bacterium]